VLAPMFIVMSFLYGLAVFILVLMFACAQDDRPIGAYLLNRLKGLMAIFIAGVLLFILIYFLTKLYGAKNYDLVNFYLVSGGRFTVAFWFGWMFLGLLAPFGIILHPVLGQDPQWIARASALVILGGLASLYVIVIGGQAFPLNLFPDKIILESGFHDGVGGQISAYAPTIPEFLLGLGGVAVAMLITAVGLRALQFLPESLADKDIDPHAAVKA
ncbi:MAG: molybdopterin oxidoreductase, partial [Gammaproteobacteria bacterium]|nr:molybdopterin oxidoreductase [Gammaproteobacteria bacterium]